MGVTVGCDGDDAPPGALDAGALDAGAMDGSVDDGGAGDAGDAGSGALCAAGWVPDSRGGVRLLRGTNVSGEAKTTPDHLPPYGAADFVRLREETGFDAIRFLVFWEAIEPTEGVYDDAYLASVRALVHAAGDAGLLVMIDMHQDGYGAGFGFTGAPRWTCDEALYASYVPPTEWFQAYFTPEVMTCFDRFYAPGRVRTAFVRAWARLARELADEPSVLLYDLLNEPSWGGSDPRTFDRTTAPDFYAELIAAIRVEDPEPYIALEPASIANQGLPTQLVLPPGEHFVYAPHMYPGAIETGPGYDGNAAAVRSQANGYCRDATRLGLPLVLGEIGARADVPGAREYLRDAWDAFDALSTSVLQWDLSRGHGYSLWDADGTANDTTRAIARPYPRRVAGRPLAWSWDAVAGVLDVRWVEDDAASGDNELALPSLVFPAGATVAVDDGAVATIDGAVARIAHVGARGGAPFERHLVARRLP